MRWPLLILALLNCRTILVVGPCKPGLVRSGVSDCVPADGEDPASEDTGSEEAGEPYHPEDYANPILHGPDTNLQVEDCRACHGDNLGEIDLDGDGDIDAQDGNCDSCHTENWRVRCNYCHGSEDVSTGAPPREIDRSTEPETFSFLAHTRHDNEGEFGPGYDCSQCHNKPLSIMTAGHIIVDDDTPAVAEVDFTSGISADASWDGMTCSNVYCHGNGQETGEIEHTAEPRSCNTSCHYGPASSPPEWHEMSGMHQFHLQSPLFDGNCAVCHGATVSDEGTIEDHSLHVNGQVDQEFTGVGAGTAWVEATCLGGCHSEARAWPFPGTSE